MTNKEAIERLQKCMRNLELGKIVGAVTKESADERIEAYALAIKALEERPHGEWIDGDCSVCGCSCKCDGWGNDIETKFCPNCGARMKRSDEE